MSTSGLSLDTSPTAPRTPSRSEPTTQNPLAREQPHASTTAVKVSGSSSRGAERRQGFTELGPSVLLTAGGVSVLAVSWLILIVLCRVTPFAAAMPQVQPVGKVVAAVCWILAAAVLLGMPPARGRRRLDWVACGLLVLAFGNFMTEIHTLLPAAPRLTLNGAMYLRLVTQIIAGVLVVIGLAGKTAPRLGWTSRILAVGFSSAAMSLVFIVQNSLAPVLHLPDLLGVATSSYALVPSLAPWYAAISLVPFALACTATVGTTRSCRDGTLGLWLLASMALWTAALLHGIFWPVAYGGIVTTSELLLLVFSCIAALGAVSELQSLAKRRVMKLAHEETQSRNLTELAVMKANFTAMVAHELGSPLGAIQGYVDMLATQDLDRDDQALALNVINGEINALTSLVRDVQMAASVEREDFMVQPRPVSLGSILSAAAAFAKTLPGDHPFTTTIAVQELVWADPHRVGQVLRNLLTNACKYTSPGTPIVLSATRCGNLVRLEVIDHGPGIAFDDVGRIFEKFGRGRHKSGEKVSGVGLGLYLSRRIIQSHGSILTVGSRIGGGSVFGFELEVIL